MFFWLIILPLIISPAFAEPIPDYENPSAPIFTNKPVYSWTDKVIVTIIAPSWNTDSHLIDSIGDDQNNPIKISAGDHFLEPYRFTETGANTGIFTAEVTLTGFPHDADGDGKDDTIPRTLGNGPNSGFLEVDRDSSITISFEFADGVVLTKSVPVRWNIGNAKFSESNFLADKSAVIQVTDPDLNLNPEALDHIPIDVFSDSDVAGINVDAVETSESSGIFIATISFSQNLPSSGSRLLALPGDEIIAKYHDHTLPSPYSTSDNIEIIAYAKVSSSISNLDRVTNSDIRLSDGTGKQINSFHIGNQIQIVGSITNEQNFNQNFIYLIQVKDNFSSVVSISWISGELSSLQNLDVSQSWVPKKNGTYFIESFVWDSLENQIPLSAPSTYSITVQ